MFCFKKKCKTNDTKKLQHNFSLSTLDTIDPKESNRLKILPIYYMSNLKNKYFKHLPDYSNLLSKHNIDTMLRIKLLDWMIEVIHFFKELNSDTYFRAISILDLFLLKTSTPIDDNDLHILSIVCIYIANKVENIKHIKLDNFMSAITKISYSINDILKLEVLILKTIDYNLTAPTLIMLIDIILTELFLFREDEKEILCLLKTISVLYGKYLILYDYMYTYGLNNIAGASIIFSLKEIFNNNCFSKNSYINNNYNNIKKDIYNNQILNKKTLKKVVKLIPKLVNEIGKIYFINNITKYKDSFNNDFNDF